MLKTEKKPNVLFIAIDDLNACLDGMNGEIQVATPNINQLASKGMLFTNAHCAAPACNPSRVSVMTGLAPATTGVYVNTQDWRENTFLKNKTTLPQHFKNNGYATFGGGKLYHAASLTKKGYSGYIDAKPWDAYFPSKTRQMPNEIAPETIPVNGNKAFYHGYFDWAALNIEPHEMADAKVVSWAEGILSQSHDKPLFLAVGIYRPHIPWWTPKAYFDKYPIDEIELPEVQENDLDDVPEAGKNMAKRNWHKWIKDQGKWKQAVQAYKASVSFTDDMVGRLLKALETGPMKDNTIVVLWSDHGYHLGQKEHWEKFALWEQTTRVPLILAAPGKTSEGKSSSQPVSLLDLYPTLNELCGIPVKEKLDGESLVPLLETPDLKTGRAVISTQKFNNHAVRSEKWRYIRYSDGSEELYNQEKDPKNFENLIGKQGYSKVIEDLSIWLPKTNAEKNPLKVHKKSKQK
ncbi:sulfatase [Flavivirga amylovorans]|uniref:Sulfatase n=1 Tax=Flavivirga amylovorans TaxID=870486 RepID=A0ABT8WW08_9FLAO|nr:sulfatase [Flavivirga amylovorans]MDO5985843.1 sulfatase [Flavivirga amylovorans]